MSTTDTRAAFEAHYRKECGMPDDVAIQWDTPYIAAAWDGWQSALAWQAATEAAKATGTAGELSDEEILKIQEKHIPKHGWSTNGLSFARDVLAAARQPAPVVARFSISEAQKSVIRRAADALEGLDYEDLAGDLRAVIPFSKGQPWANP